MEELEKIRRVIEGRLEGAPHETLLVVDATTGQNGVRQAQIFGEAVQVTGVALTKLDGSAKGGVALAIAHELGLPVKLVGVGEGVEDLRPFDPRDFARASDLRLTPRLRAKRSSDKACAWDDSSLTWRNSTLDETRCPTPIGVKGGCANSETSSTHRIRAVGDELRDRGRAGVEGPRPLDPRDSLMPLALEPERDVDRRPVRADLAVRDLGAHRRHVRAGDAAQRLRRLLDGHVSRLREAVRR